MADVFDKKKRSSIMSKVKSKGNKSTELRLIDIFKRRGWKGWRRNYKVKGKPDFVFLKKKVAVFADGCFWHGHDCRNTKPSSNKEFWDKKIARNKERDLETGEYLKKLGWKVFRLWECEIKREEIPEELARILSDSSD